jgi:hypothetical protein
MSRRSRDQSIHSEPHLQDRAFEVDQSERRADEHLQLENVQITSDEIVEHTVWDEPTISTELAGQAGADQITYARWLNQKVAETSGIKSWLVTLLVVIIAGPLGVFGALFGSGRMGAGLVMVTVVGPVTEEVMKVVGALWIVERRPYLFKSVWQILLCAAAGGAAFGFIENLIYLHFYIPNPSSKLAQWRWTVCMGLHMNCSFVAGVGVARIWYNAIRERHRPQLWLGLPWLFMAMVAHGAYNGATVLAETMGWLDFDAP